VGKRGGLRVRKGDRVRGGKGVGLEVGGRVKAGDRKKGERWEIEKG
jgi:hypothetical protein